MKQSLNSATNKPASLVLRAGLFPTGYLGRWRKWKNVPNFDEIGPYKLFFYSAEGNESPHIHIRRDRATAKFWLTPVRIARSRRFRDHELRAIQKLVAENEEAILEAWNEYFNR